MSTTTRIRTPPSNNTLFRVKVYMQHEKAGYTRFRRIVVRGPARPSPCRQRSARRSGCRFPPLMAAGPLTGARHGLGAVMGTRWGAARAAGISKASVGRAIKSGQLSALQRHDGTYSIDPSELFRVYPEMGNASQLRATYPALRCRHGGAVPPSPTPVPTIHRPVVRGNGAAASHDRST
jgi:hypothetical protein